MKWLMLMISLSVLIYICLNLEKLQGFERDLIISIHNHRNLFFEIIFRISTLFGYELLVLLIPIFTWLENKRLKKLGFEMTSHVVFILYLATLLKIYYKELRPHQLITEIKRDISSTPDYSFPSGHTACSTMAWIVIGSYLTETYPDKTLIISIFILFSSFFVGNTN